MFGSIMVPLDGSAFGEHALPLALSIAQRAQAKLTLLHVHAPLTSVYLEGAAFVDSTLEEDIKSQMRTYLEGVLKRVESARPGVTVNARLIEGDVPGSISHEAASMGADLVVMTTHGRGPLGRFWLGSVADNLVRHLPMPLLLVRPSENNVVLTDEPSLKHILIPLDGSDLAEKIIPPAMALGELTGANFTLVRMIKPVVPYSSPGDVMTVSAAVKAVQTRVEELQANLKNEAQQYLDKVADQFRADGLKVETRVDVDVQPARAILKDAEEKGVDLIALETHGRSGLQRLFLGSVADKVVRGTHVPVLVHKP